MTPTESTETTIPTESTTTDPKRRYLCRHLFADGHRCGSPALRDQQFCFYHRTTRRPRPDPDKLRHLDAHEPFELPVVEDRASALLVASHILSRIASNDLDVQRAGRLIAGLRVIVALLPREPDATAAQPSTSTSSANHTPDPALIDDPILDPILDPDLGLLAPIAELLTAPADPRRDPTPDAEFISEHCSYFNIFARHGEETRLLHRPPFTAEFIRAEVDARRKILHLPSIHLLLPEPNPAECPIPDSSTVMGGVAPTDHWQLRTAV